MPPICDPPKRPSFSTHFCWIPLILLNIIPHFVRHSFLTNAPHCAQLSSECPSFYEAPWAPPSFGTHSYIQVPGTGIYWYRAPLIFPSAPHSTLISNECPSFCDAPITVPVPGTLPVYIFLYLSYILCCTVTVMYRYRYPLVLSRALCWRAKGRNKEVYKPEDQ